MTPNYDSGPPPVERLPFSGTIRPLELGDLSSIKPILETWLVDHRSGEKLPGEVDEVLGYMAASTIPGAERIYFVAEENGKVVGTIGMMPLSDELLGKATDGLQSIEFVNAYVAPGERVGRGVGKKLFGHAEAVAREQGYGEILFSSGPRYATTAHEFYDHHLPGFVRREPIRDFYEKGVDLPVWGKLL